MQVRTPAVAGTFYPKNKKELRSAIRECFLDSFGPGRLYPNPENENPIGVICPHAGYEYSGSVAANSFYAISSLKPDLVVITGPNHWGIGYNVAAMKEGVWETPLGEVEVDTEAALEIHESSKMIELDFVSHMKDHSLEVQLPMLQEIYSHKFKILPIIIIDQSYESAKELGTAIARISKRKKTVIIGSSDFTHYEDNEYAHRQDKPLIDAILEMNIDRFYKVLQQNHVSACGYGAIASTMTACRELGATKARLARYATSGDVTGDKASVVGYASIIFS